MHETLLFKLFDLGGKFSLPLALVLNFLQTFYHYSFSEALVLYSSIMSAVWVTIRVVQALREMKKKKPDEN